MSLGIFDVIGPVMNGPSSNHTAGAARIGRIAGQIMGGLPREITITFHPMFMSSFAGQRTHEALLSGCLGYREYELPEEGPWEELKARRIMVKYESRSGAGGPYCVQHTGDPQRTRDPQRDGAAPNSSVTHNVSPISSTLSDVNLNDFYMGNEPLSASCERPEASRNYMGISGACGGVEWSIEGDSVGGGSVRIFRINGTELFYSGEEWLYLWGIEEKKDGMELCESKPGISAPGQLADHDAANIRIRIRQTAKPLRAAEKKKLEAELCSAIAATNSESKSGSAAIVFRREIPPVNRFARRAEPSFRPESFDSLARMAEKGAAALHELALRYEAERTQLKEAVILTEAERIIMLMHEAQTEGLKGKNHLLGGFCTGSDGKKLLEQARKSPLCGGVLVKAMAGAVALAERNAAGGLVVASPTGGSAGTLPGVLFAAADQLGASVECQSRALLTAGLIGAIIGNKGSFSGSTGGCQGEIGTGAAMAAGAAAYLAGGTTDMIIQAAVLALKNVLGLTCDCPVGVVEIPCIKRNAFGAAAALAAAEMALAGIRSAIPPDEVLDAFAETQRLMPPQLRGGCQKGLASGNTAARMRAQWKEKIENRSDTMIVNKKLKVAVIGAGRMGTIVAKQLPDTAEKLIIDLDREKAAACAQAAGGQYAIELSAVKDADVVAMVVPAAAVPQTSEALASAMKPGAILMNMATGGILDEEFRRRHSSIRIADCKIVGNALAMARSGAPSCVIADTGDEEVFEIISSILPGYTKVIQGNAALVYDLNAIATKEALRCGFRIKAQLSPYGLSEDMEKIVLYTVAAGTLQAQAAGDLGGNAMRLIQELRDEGELTQ